MQRFKVVEILNEYTIQVDGWYWNGKSGTIVIPTEFLNPKKYKISLSMKKLSDLIMNEYIEIGEVQSIDENKQMVAQVFYKGKNILEYFKRTKL